MPRGDRTEIIKVLRYEVTIGGYIKVRIKVLYVLQNDIYSVTTIDKDETYIPTSRSVTIFPLH